jgi:RHS repeat-associated protein
MAGISSYSSGSLINKKGYNGNELQSKEFSDGSGFELYDFNARTYDQQIGRFVQVDPATEDAGQESLTPYQFGLNNPVRYDDPDGKCPPCLVYRLLRTLDLIGRLLPTGARVSNLAIPIRDATSVIIKTVPNNFSITQNNSTAKENETVEKKVQQESEIKQLEKAEKSLQKNVVDHEKKLQEFKDNPIGKTNPALLKDKSPEVQQKVIDGRIKALEKQIKKNEGELNKTQKLLELKKEEFKKQI